MLSRNVGKTIRNFLGGNKIMTARYFIDLMLFSSYKMGLGRIGL
jgi:hypothetical protein